jgi:hypothetical protein
MLIAFWLGRVLTVVAAPVVLPATYAARATALEEASRILPWIDSYVGMLAVVVLSAATLGWRLW